MKPFQALIPLVLVTTVTSCDGSSDSFGACRVAVNNAVTLSHIQAVAPQGQSLLVAGARGPSLFLQRLASAGHVDLTIGLAPIAEGTSPRVFVSSNELFYTAVYQSEDGAVQVIRGSISGGTDHEELVTAEHAEGDTLAAVWVGTDGEVHVALNATGPTPRGRIITPDLETDVQMTIHALDGSTGHALGADGIVDYRSTGQATTVPIPTLAAGYIGATTLTGVGFAVIAGHILYDVRLDGTVTKLELDDDMARPMSLASIDHDTFAILSMIRRGDQVPATSLVVRFIHLNGSSAGDDLVMDGFEDGLGVLSVNGDRLTAAVGGHVVEWRCAIRVAGI